MERLTSPAEGYCEKYCPDCIMPGCDPEKCAHKNDVAMYEALKSIEGIVPFDRLRELAQADLEGRCVVLPRKVYQTDGVRVYEGAVRKVIFETSGIAFDRNAIGKTIFLTREEAEQALKEAERND